MPQARRWEGKRVLITGAASGIGAASARLFAADGAAVVIADIDEGLGNRVAREIRAAGGDAPFLAADVTDRRACRQMVADAAAGLGGLDVLFLATLGGDDAAGPGGTRGRGCPLGTIPRQRRSVVYHGTGYRD